MISDFFSLGRLWEREMLGDIYIPTVLPFHKKTLAKNLAGEIFTFVANSQSVKFCQLPNEKKSEIIQSAKGREGACMDYIKKTQQELQKFKISDPLFESLLL